MLTKLLLLWTLEPTAPRLVELQDLAHSRPSLRTRALRRNIERTGVIVSETRLVQGVPSGQPLGAQETICNQRSRIFEPFEGDVRFTSSCTGYFVTERLFLTAAHCFDRAIQDPNFKHMKLGRNYTSPTASIETYEIGLAVYANQLGKKGKRADWVLVEACRSHGECADLRTMKKLATRWRRLLKAKQPRKGTRRNGYLISAPHGFHLHVSSGEYWQEPEPSLFRHTIPAWARSSGGPIFDFETNRLIGVQQGIRTIDGPNLPYCDKDCRVRFSLPSKSQAYWHIPIHAIKSDLRDPVYMDPRDPQQRKEFKKQLNEALALALKTKKKSPDDKLTCAGCNKCPR